MKVFCTVVIEEPQQRDNLCRCLDIIGVEPDVKGNTIYAEYEGERETAQKLMDLFQQYPFHGISILG